MTSQRGKSYFVALIVAPGGTTAQAIADLLGEAPALHGATVAVEQAVPDEFSNGWATAMLDAGFQLAGGAE